MGPGAAFSGFPHGRPAGSALQLFRKEKLLFKQTCQQVERTVRRGSECVQKDPGGSSTGFVHPLSSIGFPLGAELGVHSHFCAFAVAQRLALGESAFIWLM